MSDARRFFSGRTLAQALSRAARHHGLPPEQLAYRVSAKRHGWVRHPRAVMIEIDPASPRLPAGERAEAPVRSPRATPAPASAPSVRESGAAPAARQPPRAATSSPAEEREHEPWDLPDEESVLAAAEAASRLLAFAGLDLAATVATRGERLHLTLTGADEAILAREGVALLDAIEALLPRVIVSLCGRRVRCRIDGGGLRSAREQELRALAQGAAAQARAAGEALLDPLPPAERRIVHLELQDEADLQTESLGRGLHKRVRIFAGRSAEGS